MDDFTAEIQAAVRQLKIERDTWQAIALQYKDAFEAQTARLQELQDVCFATQAELENERAQLRRFQAHAARTSIQSSSILPSTVDGTEDEKSMQSFGSAVVYPPEKRRRTSSTCTNPLFDRAQQCIDRRNYGSALAEVDRLLRGPLSPKARVEGLLLKSSIHRAAGPDELYEALAACSEALELCDRVADLEAFLPRIQYQRGVLYYQLRMLHQARDAFGAVSDEDALYAAAKEYYRTCDEEIGMNRAGDRRSGIDEDRLYDGGILVSLEEKMTVSRYPPDQVFSRTYLS